MSGLDIEVLRLTVSDYIKMDMESASPRQDGAEAQLAKALWGVADWLDTLPEHGLKDDVFVKALEQANIIHPT